MQFTTLALTALAALVSASPVSLSTRQATYTTNITDFIATTTCSNANEYLIFPGNITTGSCLNFNGWSYQIEPLAEIDCTFTTFYGHGCPVTDIETVYPLPAGAAPTCAYGGALDGGLHYQYSGLFTCP